MRLYFLIGGNVGDRMLYIEEAVRLISVRIGRIEKKSSVYETEPWGFEADQGFLNMALIVETDMDAVSAMAIAHSIEDELGRVRHSSVRYTSRTMDIDVIFADDIIMEQPLVIPHPRMQDRRFVLVPLAEIAEEIVHPILHKNVGELLIECSDNGAVKMYRKEKSR